MKQRDALLAAVLFSTTAPITAAGLSATAALTTSPPLTRLYNGTELIVQRANIAAGVVSAVAAFNAAVSIATPFLLPSNFTVMSKTALPPSGNRHDYMSLDKYYWDCRVNPKLSTALPATSAKPDPQCERGVPLWSSKVCCVEFCGTCGGDGCSDRPGGKPGCCVTPIRDSRRLCNETDAPCVLDKPRCDANTGLPWTRHDGITNPAMHNFDHDAMLNMTRGVLALSTAQWFAPRRSDAKRFADACAKIMQTWFVAAATRMSPKSGLEYGHFIPGVSNGSHGSLIDIHSWSGLLDGVVLLEHRAEELNASWSSGDAAAFRAWLRQFLQWLTASDVARQEINATNNHGVWCDVQILAISLFLTDDGPHSAAAAAAAAVAARARARVDIQIAGNETLPAEMARTKSFSYSQFCLDAFFHLAALLEHVSPLPRAAVFNITANSAFRSRSRSPRSPSPSPSLWNYVNALGGSIKGALDWQLKYVIPPSPGGERRPWPGVQIEPFETCDTRDLVSQCLASYYPLMRRASRVWPSSESGDEQAVATLPGFATAAERAAQPLNLLLPPNVDNSVQL